MTGMNQRKTSWSPAPINVARYRIGPVSASATFPVAVDLRLLDLEFGKGHPTTTGRHAALILASYTALVAVQQGPALPQNDEALVLAAIRSHTWGDLGLPRFKELGRNVVLADFQKPARRGLRI